MAAQPDPGFGAPWEYVLLAGAGAMFLFGWGMSRGASLQKYTFKRWPRAEVSGDHRAQIHRGRGPEDTVQRFWGVSRHLNYLGEGFISLSMALSFGHFGNPWAWIYFVFVVTIFTFRQRDDERHCAEKYGEKWAEYRARVKYRIFPGFY